MSRTCSLERVALEPRRFARSIGIRKAQQGGEGAAGREQSLGRGVRNFPVSLSLVPKQGFVIKKHFHCFFQNVAAPLPCPRDEQLSFLLSTPFLPSLSQSLESFSVQLQIAWLHPDFKI